MSVYAPSEGASSSSLAPVLRQAGAVFSGREGRSAVLHYGSAAGELAVCVRAVGLVDRSHLTKLVIEAPPEQLRQLIARLAGGGVGQGGTLRAGHAWWCGEAPGRVVVLCEPVAGARLSARLQAEGRHLAGLVVHDRSDEWAAIGLIGCTAGNVLRALGVYGESGDPRQVPPFTGHGIGAVQALWLLESDRRALALVPHGDAGQAWRAIEGAGRPFGISCVGLEAASRYSLVERAGRPASRAHAPVAGRPV
jgi:glycine cleavage system aminomethyltransferase T